MRHLSFRPTFAHGFSHNVQNPFAAQFNAQAARDNFWNEIEELFEGAKNQVATFEPHADVEELENAYKITVDLPGVNEADIDLKLEDKRLTLKAKRERKAEFKTVNANEDKSSDTQSDTTAEKKFSGQPKTVRTERFYGEYTRSFRLPQNANGSEIQAEMKNGVLEVTIPKSAETQPKSIPIKSA